MPRRQARPLPRLILMTDERMGESLWTAIAGLPRGAAIVFRHHGLPPAERRRLFEALRRIARRRGLWLIFAGSPGQAAACRADGVHDRSPHRLRRPMIRTAPAHDRIELLAARRRGADLVLISPIHPTRSHPGAAALGRARAGLLVGSERGDVVALGGMTRARATAMRTLGIRRWAAIDGLSA